MRKLILIGILLASFQSLPLLATQMGGLDLSYALVPGSTNSYIFTVRYYRDCGGLNQTTMPEPATIPRRSL